MPIHTYTVTLKQYGSAPLMKRSLRMTEWHADIVGEIVKSLIDGLPMAHDTALIQAGASNAALHEALFIRHLVFGVISKAAGRLANATQVAEYVAAHNKQFEASEAALRRADLIQGAATSTP